MMVCIILCQLPRHLIEPKPVKPQINPPKPKPPDPPSPRDTLEKGIKLYEQARYNEAIKALSSVVRELEDPEQQAQKPIFTWAAQNGDSVKAMTK